MILDIFSRYVVGWTIALRESAQLAEQLIAETAKTSGAPVSVKGFVRFALGEGVEKNESPDFAAEVAAMSGQS